MSYQLFHFTSNRNSVTIHGDGLLFSGSDEGGADVAQGIDALSVLHNPTTREMFLNELREIECFLTQRLEEMLIEGTGLLPLFFPRA